MKILDISCRLHVHHRVCKVQQKLSELQGKAVKDYLIKEGIITEDRLSIATGRRALQNMKLRFIPDDD